jgi:hypothetical protein
MSRSVFLSAVRRPAKRVRFRSDEEVPSQRVAPVRLPRRSMEEAGSSSARGRKPYTRARAKLADSSDARHGEAGFFPQYEGIVGELGKTLSPSKCRVTKIHETSSRNNCRKKVHIYEKRVKWRVVTSFGCFASF